LPEACGRTGANGEKGYGHSIPRAAAAAPSRHPKSEARELLNAWRAAQPEALDRIRRSFEFRSLDEMNGSNLPAHLRFEIGEPLAGNGEVFVDAPG